jgi:hypothetical protein
LAPILAIINAFATLRDRGVRDPLYCRLVVKEANLVGWLWREEAKNLGRDLHLGERFTLTLSGKTATEVAIIWQPMFFAEISGTPEEQRRVLWFLHQGPKVSGGTHQTIDNFECGAADWDRPASDFFLVRCGSYKDHSGQRCWRQPSDEAVSWISDPDRFRVADKIRSRVLSVIGRPLPHGERLTIRRVFAA